MKIIEALFKNRGKLYTVLLISIALHFLVGIIFGSAVLFKILTKPEPQLESPPVIESIEPQKKEYKVKLQKSQKKSSAPLPDPIVAETPSDVNLEDLDLNMNMDRRDLAVGALSDGMGEGDGSGDAFGSGFDMDIDLDMDISFFGAEGGGDHLIFVVDFSKSMQSKGKEIIMRRELTRALGALPDGIMFDLILFSGPTWRAEDGPESLDGSEWIMPGNHHTHRPMKISQLPEADYVKASKTSRRKMIEAAMETPLSGGTVYDLPLYIALTAKPAPETIFFMTDGACAEERGIQNIRKIVSKLEEAGRKVPVINTIGFELSKNPQLQAIADLTGGTFTIMTTAEYIAEHGEAEVEIPTEKRGFGGSRGDVNSAKPLEFDLR